MLMSSIPTAMGRLPSHAASKPASAAGLPGLTWGQVHHTVISDGGQTWEELVVPMFGASIMLLAVILCS